MIHLTQDRAISILSEAKNMPGIGPWCDKIKLSLEEKKDLNKAWDLLPGNTNQIDVLNKIANGTLTVPEF